MNRVQFERAVDHALSKFQLPEGMTSRREFNTSDISVFISDGVVHCTLFYKTRPSLQAHELPRELMEAFSKVLPLKVVKG